jgi:hypothetical protein
VLCLSHSLGVGEACNTKHGPVHGGHSVACDYPATAHPSACCLLSPQISAIGGAKPCEDQLAGLSRPAGTLSSKKSLRVNERRLCLWVLHYLPPLPAPRPPLAEQNLLN